MLWTALTLAFLSPLCTGLWPMPRGLAVGNTAVHLAGDFSIHLSIPDAPADLLSSVSTVEFQLQHDSFQRLVVGRAAADTAAIAPARKLRILDVSLTSYGIVRPVAEEATMPIGSRSESYNLNIPHDGTSATLVANSTLGLFRGLTTFAQMWYSSASGKYILNAPVNIVDEPAFVSASYTPPNADDIDLTPQ